MKIDFLDELLKKSLDALKIAFVVNIRGYDGAVYRECVCLRLVKNINRHRRRNSSCYVDNLITISRRPELVFLILIDFSDLSVFLVEQNQR